MLDGFLELDCLFEVFYCLGEFRFVVEEYDVVLLVYEKVFVVEDESFCFFVIDGKVWLKFK